MKERQQDNSPWIFHLFLALIVWLPLPLASNRPWAWSIMEVWVFILVGASLWQIQQGKMQLPLALKAAWPVLLILGLDQLWVIFQLIPLPFAWVQMLSPMAADIHASATPFLPTFATISLDTHNTVVSAIKGITYLSFFALILLLVNSFVRVKWLAYTIIGSGLFQAFYGSIMTLSGLEYGFFIKKFSYLGVATGTFINRDHFAGYLEMCLAVGIGLLIANLSSKSLRGWRVRTRQMIEMLLGPKARLRLALAMMVIALVLTHSRMGNSAFFASLLIAGVIGLILSRHATRSTVVLLISLIVIDLFIVGAWFGAEKVVQRLAQTSMESEHRDEVALYSLNMLRDYPLTGTGAGSYYSSFPRYRQGDIGGFYDHAHNDYLEFGTEHGFVGLGFLGSAVLLSLFTALKAQRLRRAPLMRGMSFASIMGITALLIHSTVDFNLQIPANAAMFMIIMAMGWISLHLVPDRKVRTKRRASQPEKG